MGSDSLNHAPPEDRFVTIEYVEQLFDVSRPTVVEWIASGELPHYRLGGRTIRIERTDLEGFIAGRRRIGASTHEAPVATTKKGRKQSDRKPGTAPPADISSRCSSPDEEAPSQEAAA